MFFFGGWDLIITYCRNRFRSEYLANFLLRFDGLFVSFSGWLCLIKHLICFFLPTIDGFIFCNGKVQILKYDLHTIVLIVESLKIVRSVSTTIVLGYVRSKVFSLSVKDCWRN